MKSCVIRLIVDGLPIECLVDLRNAFVAKEPTGAREELVTDRASCRAVATSQIC